LQGEGQEFESPRLHQQLRNGIDSGGSDPARGSTHRELKTPGGPRDDRAPKALCRRLRGRSSSRLRVSPSVVPLIRDLRGSSPTSGPLEPPARQRNRTPASRGQHLDNWNELFGSKSIFDFAESRQGYDPDRSHPRLAARSDAGGGQATKGTGWMPWRQEPMKDVAGCVKLRGAASRL
jgi:hypothetical protein